ncbi:MAG: L-histidine N(alpha)-methyltransferase [Pseudomonadota bacterium]
MDGNFATDGRTAAAIALRDDAIAGLSEDQKQLSPKWLYDHRGSALFEQITTLPEYYLTRTETDILRRYAGDLAQLVPAGGALVELGAGASVKTRLLLDEGQHFGTYVPTDISVDFLAESAATLQDMYPHIPMTPIAGDFLSPIAFPPSLQDSPKVGFFPGSTIGNLTPQNAVTLLQRAAGWPGVERFILGADLVKDPATLVAAYDDSQGVTARFIANILVRLNAEVGANFDLESFTYRATWNADLARIDMEMVATRDQTVDIDSRTISFVENEAIHISASRKYTERSLQALVAAAGWRVERLLTDPAKRFAVAVLGKET